LPLGPTFDRKFDGVASFARPVPGGSNRPGQSRGSES